MKQHYMMKYATLAKYVASQGTAPAIRVESNMVELDEMVQDGQL